MKARQAASAWLQSLSRAWRYSVQLARRLIGVPDYQVYLAHLRERHPERPLPSYEQFFRERQEARYKGGGGRCC